jgi:hypothetical protein
MRGGGGAKKENKSGVQEDFRGAGVLKKEA